MAGFSKTELIWWLREPEFDRTAWWMNRESRSVNLDDARLLEGIRNNRTKIFRPGPIYWEILRRHPELPRLRTAARGNRASNLSGKNLIKRLEVLDPRTKGPAFFLIGLYHLPWPNLPGDVPQRFEQYLPGFSRGSPPEIPPVPCAPRNPRSICSTSPRTNWA